MSSSLIPKRLKWPALIITIVFMASSTMAAWHDEHQGTAIRAHHVHLSGYGSDNTLQRRLMMEAYTACSELNPKLDRPVQTLPAGGIPAIIQSFKKDMYYASDRTLTSSSGRRYTLDRGNCAIVAIDNAKLQIVINERLCEVDLIRQKAHGLCAVQTPGAAPSSTQFEPYGDLSKVPEQFRAQALAAAAKLRFKQPSGVIWRGTGRSKTIAGQRCEVYENALPMEICIARPASRFTILTTPTHPGVPGLLLEEKGPVTNMTAEEVTLDMSLSAEAFAVPANILRNSVKQ